MKYSFNTESTESKHRGAQRIFLEFIEEYSFNTKGTESKHRGAQRVFLELTERYYKKIISISAASAFYK